MFGYPMILFIDGLLLTLLVISIIFGCIILFRENLYFELFFRQIRKLLLANNPIRAHKLCNAVPKNRLIQIMGQAFREIDRYRSEDDFVVLLSDVRYAAGERIKEAKRNSVKYNVLSTLLIIGGSLGVLLITMEFGLPDSTSDIRWQHFLALGIIYLGWRIQRFGVKVQKALEEIRELIHIILVTVENLHQRKIQQ